MIRVSRADRARRGRSRGEPARSALLRAWHAACCLILTPGCLWLGPPPEEWDQNVPPEIVQPYPESPILQIGPAGAQAWLIARDEDADDVVTFAWWLSIDGYVGTAVPIADGSLVELDYDAGLDAQELRCLVFDTENESVEVVWTLEVL